ncbi:sigma 54-interacting transcriptional regulator [Vibrio lentus]|nr:sigma 54-interacting transcriptional regulator [Vibrio lentus]
MQEVFTCGRLSRSSISVLINGESGTGKELVAHALPPQPRAKKTIYRFEHGCYSKDDRIKSCLVMKKAPFTGANSVHKGALEHITAAPDLDGGDIP